MRTSGRAPNQLRPLSITRAYTRHAEGSVLIECGDTHVLCTASIEEKVPPFLKGKGQGWLTAEYGMLPRSTNTRMQREAAAGKQSGRTQEIQRLIGRSLRAVVDLTLLGERTIQIDCDVIQADGGTRTASITGAFVALHDAVQLLMERKLIAGVATAGFRRRRFGGRIQERAGAGPGLRGGLGLRDRHERRDDRQLAVWWRCRALPRATRSAGRNWMQWWILPRPAFGSSSLLRRPRLGCELNVHVNAETQRTRGRGESGKFDRIQRRQVVGSSVIRVLRRFGWASTFEGSIHPC